MLDSRRVLVVGGKTHLESSCCAILIYIVCLLYDGNSIEWRGLKEKEIKGGSKQVSVQSLLVRSWPFERLARWPITVLTASASNVRTQGRLARVLCTYMISHHKCQINLMY